LQYDKGKTLVIINPAEYSKRVQTFLAAKKFPLLSKNPTNKYKKTRTENTATMQSNLLEKQRKILVQKNPSNPKLKAQLKLHKPDITIHPVTNSMKAPTYKTSKYLLRMLRKHLTFNNHYCAGCLTDTLLEELPMKNCARQCGRKTGLEKTVEYPTTPSPKKKKNTAGLRDDLVTLLAEGPWS